MSNLTSAHYEWAGDKLKGRSALLAYAHSQNDLMTPPVTPEDMASWRRLQAKIIRTRELMICNNI